MQRGDLPRAAKLCQAHLEAQPDDVRGLTLMGALLGQSSEPGNALPPLYRARELAPHDDKVLNNLGLVHLALGETLPARSAFEDALAIAPHSAPAHLNLARLLMSLHEFDAAEAHYRDALAAKPDYVEAMAGLAELLEHGSREEEAAQWCERILGVDPQHPGANLTLANLDLRAGRWAGAVERIDATLSRGGLVPANRALALGSRGEALEKLGRYEAAFNSFTGSNDILHELFAGRLETRRESFAAPENIARLGRFFTRERLADWPREAAADAGPAPAFLVGFPRSGTTLLDRILSTHSEVVTLEERENLTDLYVEFGASDRALAGLETLATSELLTWRRRYWERVRGELGGAARDTDLVVDKLPLNTILLGFIARVFPDAPIIFAVRDPRDVCLSCFQQRFDLNPAMFQLLRFETTVTYYDAVMNLGCEILQGGCLRYHLHRYERLVHEPRAALGDLLAFLGLDWEEGVLEYQRTARERYTSTPSARQVVRPLYTDSIARWRNYEQWLRPQLERLNGWVKVYGYQP